jgi:hypothetical protein
VITVRVQDPRVQNEGSWNSYVDYKIFLHVSQALVMVSAAGLWAVLRSKMVCGCSRQKIYKKEWGED